MKKFLSTTKGKIIAGAVTFVVIAAAIVLIVLLNTGYRSIQVADLNGTTKITSGLMVSEAFKGQNLQSNTSVSVSEKSDLTLALDTDKHVYAKELTRFRLEAFGTAGKDSRTVIRLEEGSVLSEIDEKLLDSESYVVDAPNATMAVRGTTFTVTVSYDEEGLCHTAVEVEKGTVEVTKKDENGFPTDNVQTLNAGDKTEVISEVKRSENPAASGTTSAPSGSSDTREPQEIVYQDPEALAVESALETFLNGGELDTADFDRITWLEIYGKVAFVTLDDRLGGKGENCGMSFSGEEITSVSYRSDTGEEIEIPTSSSSLTDLNFLTGMKRLRQLYIYSGNITDITPIGKLTELVDLSLEYNKISDISPVENLTKLFTLNLDNNLISDISAISGLKNLRNLGLLDNNISDLTPVGGLTKLTSLGIGSDNISDLSTIAGLTNLTWLHISGENVSDISPIANLHKLEGLYISCSSVKDYSPLYGLTGLNRIYLYDSDVSEEELAKLQQALPDTEIND